MWKIITCLFAAVLITQGLSGAAVSMEKPDTGIAEPASLSALIENAKTLDGKSLQVRGELIGEPLQISSTSCWLNIIEEGNPCSVFVASSTILSVNGLSGGNYHKTGHHLCIVGTLNRICREHGGDLDLHATGIEIVSDPKPINRVSLWWEKWLVLIMLLISAILWYFLPKAGSQK